MQWNYLLVTISTHTVLHWMNDLAVKCMLQYLFQTKMEICEKLFFTTQKWLFYIFFQSLQTLPLNENGLQHQQGDKGSMHICTIVAKRVWKIMMKISPENVQTDGKMLTQN